MTDRQPLFSSREELERRMDKAGLTPGDCVYSALNKSVNPSFGMGFYTGTKESVLMELAKYGNSPLEVTIDTESPDPMKHKADIMCAACGMCVTVVGGFEDDQQVVLDKEGRECPVFEQPQPAQTTEEV